MLSLTLSEIATAIDGQITGGATLRPTGLSIDTRTLKYGDIFFAFQGEQQDGHTYVAKAFASGAVAAVVRESYQGKETPLIRVKNSEAAILAFGKELRRRIKDIPIVAVTGSNGKTTTKNMLGALLHARGETVFSQKSFNNLYGLPITLAAVTPTTRHLVLELGTNHPGELMELYKASFPTLGGVTLVGPSHLEGFVTLENVAKEKFSFFGPGLCERLIYNQDDPYSVTAAEKLPIQKHSFGEAAKADYRLQNLIENERGISFLLNGNPFTCKVLGRHNAQNTALALALADQACGGRLDWKQAAEILAGCDLPPHRLTPIALPGEITVLDDCYNCNPRSLSAAIATFAKLKIKGKKWVLLGEMRELGPTSDKLHEECGKELLSADIEGGAGLGPRAELLLQPLQKAGRSVGWFENVADCGKFLSEHLTCGDWLLVKASRGVRLERVIEDLEGRLR